MTAIVIRPATAADYNPLIGQLDAWWGGRSMTTMLPRLFFQHFGDWCLVAEDGDQRVGFVAGLRSETDPERAYIHFAGVAPSARGRGLGRDLYDEFFTLARAAGCTSVRCVTAPTNSTSIAFHRRLGFTYETDPTDPAQPLAEPDYDGPGQDRVVLTRSL